MRWRHTCRCEPDWDRWFERNEQALGQQGSWASIDFASEGAIDPDWMRWLVGMRVHHAGGANSFWLPLFSGPRDGRPGRVFSQLLGESHPPVHP